MVIDLSLSVNLPFNLSSPAAPQELWVCKVWDLSQCGVYADVILSSHVFIPTYVQYVSVSFKFQSRKTQMHVYIHIHTRTYAATFLSQAADVVRLGINRRAAPVQRRDLGDGPRVFG